MSEILKMDMDYKMDKATQTEQERLLPEVIKQEKEISAEQGKLVSLGILMGDTAPEHWTGAISLSRRLDSEELTRDEVNQQHSQLSEYFVEAKMGAPKRCGDGRTVDGFTPLSINWHLRGLGVQIFGGSCGDATGIRLSKGYTADVTFVDDVESITMNHESDFALGDHTDDHAEGEKTGCGAIDGQLRKNEIYLDLERGKTLQTIMEFLYDKAGLPLPAGLFEQLKQNAQTINDYADEYFADKHLVLDTIKDQSPNGVEPLVGEHNETSLTLNFVEGTTFNRDLYNAGSDGKIQNFNVDVWSILKEHGDNAGFVLADAVATALDLTDGSIEVFARVPNIA